MKSQVVLKDRGNSEYKMGGIDFVPKNWSASDLGGFRRATIEAYGEPEKLLDLAEILRYDATIYNRFGHPVWNGFVNEVTIYLGSVSIGFTLSRMANKVKVFYNSVEISGSNKSAYTDWASNSDSQVKYGVIERIISEPDISSTTATTRATRAVADLGNPVSAVSFEGSGRNIFARIECLGWYHTLDWRVYREERGYESYISSGQVDQKIGAGVISNEIGFINNTDGTNNYYTININSNALQVFDESQQIRVTGSVSNNGLLTILEHSRREYENYAFTGTMSSDDIYDAASQMNQHFDIYDMVKLGSSINNDGFYEAKNVVAGRIEVNPAPLVAEPTPASLTLEAGTRATLSAATVQELPSISSPYNITVVDLGQTLSREFTPTATGSWAFYKVLLKVKVVGSPADNLQVSLATDAGSQSYSIIESATVAGSSISTGYGWVEFVFTGNNSLTFGSDYAILVTRTGNPDWDDYYVVQMDDDSPNAGVCYVNDGVAWMAHPSDADLLYQIVGVEETTTQMDNILSSTAPLLSSYFIEEVSGIDDVLYMSEYLISRVRFEQLVKYGWNSGSSDLIVTIDLKKNLYIKGKPSYDRSTSLKMTTNGTILDSSRDEIQEGEMVHGQWIDMEDAFTAYGYSVNQFRTYIAQCEWDDANGSLKVIPRVEDPFDKLNFLTNN